jgi:transcriptional regulator with XRE-family HTH domain
MVFVMAPTMGFAPRRGEGRNDAGPDRATQRRPRAGTLADVIEGDLARFLRSRRESVSPADVGLPTGPRRRTPGLRRAELATLAGISVDYLVRLEQGRDTRPSAQVLAAIADALRLDDEDRGHLRLLAAISSGRELCPGGRPLARAVRPTVQGLLASLEPTAAYVVNRLSDVLAFTPAFERIVAPLGMLDGSATNLARFVFCDERSRSALPDWAAVADEQVGDLHAGAAGTDPDLAELVAELTEHAGSSFTDRWAAHGAAVKRSGLRRVVHPDVGELRVAFETLQLPDADEQRLVIWLPADEATSAALDQLNGRYPGALHAVTQAAS